MTRARSSTFRSLQTRNFKLYTGGQLISVTGTGMQQVAQSWLVLELTDSGAALGITVALQFLPMLLFGVWGGLLADRLDKRRVLIATQAAQGVLALALWGLVVTGSVTLWQVYVLAFLLGCAFAIDMPTRQSFTIEMVGPDQVSNAVALNSAVFNSGRLLGPAVGGVIIASMGVGPCFLVNGISYIATVLALRAMRPGELFRQPPAPREKAQVRAGLRYAWRTAEVRRTLLLVTVIGTVGFNFVVVLPLLAKDVFDGGPRLLGTLMSLMGMGALAGALVAARRAMPTRPVLVGAAMAFGAFELLAAVATTPPVAGVFVVAMGAAMMLFLATANSTLQLSAEPNMRGRVMALYGLVFLGGTPFGGPLMGWLGEHVGPRFSLVVGGGVSLLTATGIGWVLLRADGRPLRTYRPRLRRPVPAPT
ncbi:MAG: MFS transporter, partial [Acidimicrobiales bacterium]